MAKKSEPDPVRAALEPLIRSAGIRQTAESVGLHYSNLGLWLGKKRTLPKESRDKLFAHFGLRLIEKVEKIP